MLSASRWIARMRYSRRTKRLQKGFVNDACRLIRADKNLAFEAASASGNKKTTDVCTFPFQLSRQSSLSHRRYVLYNSFYCIFPPEEKTPGDNTMTPDEVLRAYGGWLAKAKTEHTLPADVLEAIKRDNKTFVYQDAAAVLNHFFVCNKFVWGGYVLSSGDDGEDTTITLVYYRTQAISKDGGIVVDPNIFCLMESIGDITTNSEINNEWCGTIAKEVSMAQLGVDTNISSVPLDKTLYGTVTCALKTTFYTQTEHAQII